MKIYTYLCTLPVLAGVPVAPADINTGKPATSVDAQIAAEGQPTTGRIYHSDLLASNAVHAVFKEIRSIPVVSLDDAAPRSEEVAVFEVKQNLAHRRYDRMGDGPLQVKGLFPVSLAADLPGQDASVGAQIREMKPGDEALLNIDHIYVFRENGNENVRACTRFAKVQPQPTDSPEQPADAPSVAPSPTAPSAATPFVPATLPRPVFSSTSRSVESRITIEPDGQGGMRRLKVEIHRETTADGQERVRKFINDVEVDPQTDQPLSLSGEPSAPAVQPAAQPTQAAPAAPTVPKITPPAAPPTPAKQPAIPVPIPDPVQISEY